MTISEARLEFQKRYDLWAIHMAEREVEESFPHFRVFKGGIAWKFYEFVRQLTLREQLAFIRIKRKDAYLRATGGRGEPLSKDEKQFLDRYRGYCPEHRDLGLEIRAKRRGGEKIKLTSKKTLQKAITEKFVSAFGDRGVTVEPNLFHGVGFQMSSAGWLVITTFTFGGQEVVMDYRHLIAREAGRVNPNGTLSFPAPVLAMLCWIGICYIEWAYLMDEDVGPACDSAVELCRQVFDVLPKLLSGLERDRVTGE